eukprot:COSAG01_NODE_5436_length_4263_cov_363.287944_3_plen_55_part_01
MPSIVRVEALSNLKAGGGRYAAPLDAATLAPSRALSSAVRPAGTGNANVAVTLLL